MSRIKTDLIPEKRAFQRSLLAWYARHKRNLPWRRDRDPYRILVSEFMLQQTRVETVIPYFDRFLTLFPTLESLSRARLQKVLKSWAGLGYYARARHLHAAARYVCAQLGGKIPETKIELLKLPGLGAYTAGAVASLAFDEPVAAVDGNVHRVLGRLLRKEIPRENKREWEKRAEELIPPGRAGDFNQAMMELGAVICNASQARCPSCPVNRFCASNGRAHRKPRREKKQRDEVWAVSLIEREGCLAIFKNEARGLLRGLWQFPTAVINAEADRRKMIFESKKTIKERFGLEIAVRRALPQQEYYFTHIHARILPFLCSAKEVAGGKGQEKMRWVRPENFSRYPISTAMRRIAALIPRSLG